MIQARLLKALYRLKPLFPYQYYPPSTCRTAFPFSTTPSNQLQPMKNIDFQQKPKPFAKANGYKEIKTVTLSDSDSKKISDNLKFIMEGVLIKVNEQHLKLIKKINEESQKSITILQEILKKDQLERLIGIRTQTNLIKKFILDCLVQSTAECLNQVHAYLSSPEIRKAINPNPQIKSKVQMQRYKSHLLDKFTQRVKVFTEKMLAEEKAEIEVLMKNYGESYLNRVRLNQQEKKPLLEDDFLRETYSKDLERVKNKIQSFGTNYFLKIDEIITKTDEKVDYLIHKKSQAKGTFK